MEPLQRQPVLLEVVLALHPPARFAGGIHRRQQQSDEHADDDDHHQEFDEREARFVEESLGHGRTHGLLSEPTATPDILIPRNSGVQCRGKGKGPSEFRL